MEAPEKIFICDYGSELSYEWHSESEFESKCHNDIEYTRTDAFIEKAYDFIHRKICDYIVHYNYGSNNDMETMYVDGRFFDDFKNYMKGE